MANGHVSASDFRWHLYLLAKQEQAPCRPCVWECRESKKGLPFNQPKINAKRHFQAEKFVNAARLCRNTINILVMYGSEKYLSVSEPVSKHYKREPAVLRCWGVQLCLSGFSQQFASLQSPGCFPVCQHSPSWQFGSRSNPSSRISKRKRPLGCWRWMIPG